MVLQIPKAFSMGYMYVNILGELMNQIDYWSDPKISLQTDHSDSAIRTDFFYSLIRIDNLFCIIFVSKVIKK